MAWTLCKKEDVIALSPSSAASIPDFFSDIVEGLIRERLGAPGIGTHSLVEREQHRGTGTNMLFVNRPPIIGVSELRIHNNLIPPDSFLVGKRALELKYGMFPDDCYDIFVSYESGTFMPEGEEDTTLYVESSVRLAAASMIVALLNYRGKAGADQSIKWSNVDQKEGEASPNVNIGLTSHLTKIMDRMLKRETIKVR
jgi:hypothetical protein